MVLDLGSKLNAKIKTDDIQTNLMLVLFLFNLLYCLSRSILGFWTQTKLPIMFLSWNSLLSFEKLWTTTYFYMVSMYSNKLD